MKENNRKVANYIEMECLFVFVLMETEKKEKKKRKEKKLAEPSEKFFLSLLDC